MKHTYMAHRICIDSAAAQNHISSTVYFSALGEIIWELQIPAMSGKADP